MNCEKKVWDFLIKVAILGVLSWFVYSKLTNIDSQKMFEILYGLELSPRTIGLFLILIYLTYWNLLLEALKWRILVRDIESISWKTTVKSMLAGQCLALFTPNRIGEFSGRVLFLKKENRLKGSIATWIGAFSQMMVTNVIGVLSLGFFAIKYLKMEDYSIVIILLELVFAIFFIFIVINLDWIYKLIERISFFDKFKNDFLIIKSYSNKVLAKVFGFSLFRYITFSFQYFLIISIFIQDANYFDVIITIGVVYMVQSAIPTFILTDVGVRGAVAVFFFGFLFKEAEIVFVLASTVFLWIINLAIPSFIGLYYILKTNVTRN